MAVAVTKYRVAAKTPVAPEKIPQLSVEFLATEPLGDPHALPDKGPENMGF
jgi:hypothetical protein